MPSSQFKRFNVGSFDGDKQIFVFNAPVHTALMHFVTLPSYRLPINYSKKKKTKDVGRSTQQNQNDRVTSQKHLTNETILIDGPALLPASQARGLGPHLLDILQDHVAMAVEGLDARQQLAVVAARDQHLRVRAHGRLQDGQRARGELVLLQLRDLEFCEIVARLCEQFLYLCVCHCV